METKEKILMAATEEFANKGFYGATTRDICKKVDMNIAAANYHFNTKLELYRQVFKNLFLKINDNTVKHKNILNLSKKEEPIKFWILNFLFALLDDTPAIRWKALLIAREMTNPSEIFPWLFDNYFNPIISELQKILEKVFPNRNQDQISLEVFSVLSQCLFYVQNRSIVESVFSKNFYSKNKLIELATHIYTGLIAKAKYYTTQENNSG